MRKEARVKGEELKESQRRKTVEAGRNLGVGTSASAMAIRISTLAVQSGWKGNVSAMNSPFLESKKFVICNRRL